MAPGLWLTFVALTGLTAGLLHGGIPTDGLAAAVALGSMALICRRRRLLALALMAATGCAAVAYGAAAREHALQSPLRRWFVESAGRGRLADVVRLEGALRTDAEAVDGGVRLTIAVRAIDDGLRTFAVTGEVQATVGGVLANRVLDRWTAGRRIAAPVLLRDPTIWRNPGSPSPEWQRLRRPFDLSGTIKSGALVEVAPGAWWDEAGAAVRRRVRRAAARYIAPRDPAAAAVIPATLIGDRAGLPEDVEQRLQAAGTYHAIVISGAHIVLLMSISFAVLRLIFRSFRLVAGATMVLVIAYGWLVGPSASVRRAVGAGVIYLSIGLLGHRPRALPVLSATALIVCLASPLTLVDVGAWLSFAATAGIIVGAGPFVEWATRTQPPSPRPRWPRRLWIALLGIFGATVAAELMVFPITANVFSRVGVLGLVLNFVAVPAIAVVQVAGTAMTVLDAFWPSAAAVCGQVAGVASGWLIESARAVDRAPALVWRTPPSSLLWTAGYYAALGAAMWFRGRAPRRIAMAAAALCAVVIATAPWLSRAQPRSGWLRVTFLDVGQGDAIVVQFPSGESLLVDAGGAPGAFDIGDRVVTPALWALGIRALDWMALTHGDLDHAGGAPAVARDVRPREIWEGVPVPFDRGLLALRTQAHRDRIGWRGTRAGDRLEVGSAVVEVLHPPAPDWERRGVRNDDSLVLRIGFGAVDLLLTGDSGEEFEAAFDPMSAPAPMRILKVAHHGSRTSTSASFLQRFAPQMAIVSAGRGNPFGHPAPAVLERLQQARVVLFRTDQDGAVVMETDGRHVDVRTSSGRHWRMTSEAGP